MQYKVLEGASIRLLELEVEEYMEEGWVPQGGVWVHPLKHSPGENAYQAMIKK